MATKLGTAYVDVQPDLSSLTKQVSTFFAGSKWSGATKAAGAVAGIGVAAGVTAKALFDIGAEFDEAFDKIRTQTGATGKELGRLQSTFKKVVAEVPTDFAAASDAVAGLNQRLDLTGRPLRALTKQVLELSRITGTDVGDNVQKITRLFGDWSVKTKKQQDTLDGLYRVSTETGVAVADLAEIMTQFGSPLRTLGLDFDQTAAMVAKFEKEGVNITTLMSGLRLSVANLSAPTDDLKAKFKDLGITAKEPADQILQVMGAIEKLKTSAGNTLAMEVFGRRAGSDMAAAVREGRFEVEELMGVFNKGQDTIRDAGRDTMDFGEHWQKFGNRLKVFVEPVATAVFKALGDGMKALSKIDLSSVTDDLKEFWQEAGVVRDVVKRVAEGVKDTFGGMIDFVKSGVKLIGSILRGDFGDIWDAVKGIFKAGVRLALAPIRGMISLVRDIGGRIGDALEGALGGAWDRVKSIFEGGLDVVLTVVNAVLDVVEEIPGVGDLGPIANPLGGAGAQRSQTSPDTTLQNQGGGGGSGKRNANRAHAEKHYTGGKITKPTALVGEEAPAHPEFVIATNPAYRDRNQQLWMQAGHEIGIPGFQTGGTLGEALTENVRGASHYIGKLPSVDEIPAAFGGLGGYIIDKATAFIKDKVSSAAESVAGAVTGGMKGEVPKGGIPALIADSIKLAASFGLSVGASNRPGAASYHNIAYDPPHQARDFSNGDTTPEMMKFSIAAMKRYGVDSILELFYNPLGFQIDNYAIGPMSVFDHTDHVHLAFKQGGIRMLEMLAGGGQRGKKGVPDALQKFDKVYPSAMYPSSAWTNLTQIPDKYIAAMAEWAGDSIGKDVPGVTMMKVQKGEGANRPGSRGDDNGDGRPDGYGLWAITRPWGAGMVEAFGGYEGMNNPISNALVMAEMYPPGYDGGNPWYGWEAAAGDMNHHYTGKLLESSGGGGGGSGDTTPGGAGTDAYGPVPSSGNPLGSPWAQAFLEGSSGYAPTGYEAFVGVSKTVRNALKQTRKNIAFADELIANQEILDAMPSSELGSDLGDTERAKQIGLNEMLQRSLLAWQAWLKQGLRTPNLKTAVGARLMEELALVQGITGGGGRLLDVQATLADLRGETATNDQLEANAAQLAEILADKLAAALQNQRVTASQLPIFADLFRRVPFGGSFAEGGLIPGAPGAPVGVVAHGGEYIIPEQGLNITVVVKDGAVNSDAIDVVVNDRLAQVARASSPVGGTPAQRVRRR